jgi:hypothetical protein
VEILLECDDFLIAFSIVFESWANQPKILLEFIKNDKKRKN